MSSDERPPIKDRDDQGADQLIDRLKKALRKDGDFPVSAKIVKEISELTSDPRATASQLSEIILREPTLGVRVLHIVNSSFYRRAKPIMTVSQAVIQIGMKPLAELCSNLVLLQRFVPAARQGGAFASCLRATLLTSLMSNLVSGEAAAANGPATTSKSETGHLFGLFSEIGTLLLAFYFPLVYENAVKRAEQKKMDISRAIHELTGLTSAQLSIEVLKALELPDFYRDVILAAEEVGKKAATFQDQKNEVMKAASTLYVAKSVASCLAANKNSSDLESVLAKIKLNVNLPQGSLTKVLGKLPEQFRDYCASVELALPPLPTYLENYSENKTKEKDTATPAKDSSSEDSLTQYINEIRAAVEAREPTSSIITTVMETFAWGLGFDRVLLLLITPNRNRLVGRMLLGKMDNLDPAQISRPLGSEASPHSPDAAAVRHSKPIFSGDPVLPNGWPFVAIPVGYSKRTVGVIYADRISGDESELPEPKKYSVGLLAEQLDRSITLQQV